MATKSLPLGMVLCALVTFHLEAATVSFLVIETGLPAELGTSQHSGLWESGLLDVFFDAGYIVSNAPVLRIPQKPVEALPPEAQANFNDALEGGADFIILALLDYMVSAGPASSEIQKPRNISLRVFRARPQKLIYEQQYTDTNSTTLKDEYDSVKKAVRLLVSHVE